jgi:hypothetical protein
VNKLMMFITLVLYLIFGAVGAFAALIISLLVSANTEIKPNISWQKFKIYYHASWFVPCFFGMVSFLFYEPLNYLNVIGVIEKLRLLHSPWDRIAQAMLSNDSATANKFAAAYFSGYWKNFYPTAQIGLVAGSIVYGAALGVLASKKVTPIRGTVTSKEYWQSVLLTLFLCLFASFGTQFLEFSIMPGGRGAFSRMSPVIVFAMTWTLMLFVAVLSHALLSRNHG